MKNGLLTYEFCVNFRIRRIMRLYVDNFPIPLLSAQGHILKTQISKRIYNSVLTNYLRISKYILINFFLQQRLAYRSACNMHGIRNLLDSGEAMELNRP